MMRSLRTRLAGSRSRKCVLRRGGEGLFLEALCECPFAIPSSLTTEIAAAQKRFINDTIRSDFHKRFLNRYIK